MRSSSRPLVVIPLLVLTALAARAMVLPGATHAWLHASGAVIPTGSHAEAFDKPVRYLGVRGERHVSRHHHGVEASAFHVVSVFPRGASVADGYRGSSGDGVRQVDHQSWIVTGRWGFLPRPVLLRTSYNPVLRTVRMAGRTYFLPLGNVFVVRYDEHLRPRVTQVRATVSGDPGGIFGMKTFERVQALSILGIRREDPEAARALSDLYSDERPARARCSQKKARGVFGHSET